MDRLLTMILRRFIGRLVNKGIDAATRDDGTPDGQAIGRAAARNTKAALRMARRIGRF